MLSPPKETGGHTVENLERKARPYSLSSLVPQAEITGHTQHERGIRTLVGKRDLGSIPTAVENLVSPTAVPEDDAKGDNHKYGTNFLPPVPTNFPVDKQEESPQAREIRVDQVSTLAAKDPKALRCYQWLKHPDQPATVTCVYGTHEPPQFHSLPNQNRFHATDREDGEYICGTTSDPTGGVIYCELSPWAGSTTTETSDYKLRFGDEESKEMFASLWCPEEMVVNNQTCIMLDEKVSSLNKH